MTPPTRSTPRRPGGGYGWRGLPKRAATASVMAPVAIYCTWLGGWVLSLLMGLIVVPAALEWARMVERDTARAIAGGTILAVAGAASVVVVGIWPTAVWIVLVASALPAAAVSRNAPLEMGFGMLYVGCAGPAFLFIREEAGRTAGLALLAIAFAVDIGAYFGGKAIGGARMVPSISPAKTWSGAISGFLAAATTGLGVAMVAGGDPLHWLLWALAIGLVAQLGDLLESAFKRRFGLKDSSNLVPGHGGVLDRMDSMMAVCPFVLVVFLLAPDLLPQAN